MPTGTGGKLTRAQVDAQFGPLRLGREYSDGAGGRVNLAPAWVAANIVKVKLFDGKVVRLHRLVAAEFAQAYEAAVKASGYHPASVQTFVPRHLLWKPGANLSFHTYGIAVDFDPGANPYGPRLGKLDAAPAFVREMEARGWKWGGRWRPGYRDSMHFERTAA